MSPDTGCDHEWGSEPELVETGLGELLSPLCKHCGAVKLVEEDRAADRRYREIAEKLYQPKPAPKPPVHTHQVKFFEEV